MLAQTKPNKVNMTKRIFFALFLPILLSVVSCTAVKQSKAQCYTCGAESGYAPAQYGYQYEYGYQYGYEGGYQYGYEGGYQYGYENGYEGGYEGGYQYGYENGYEGGYEGGYQYGYEGGYQYGYETAYESAYPANPVDMVASNLVLTDANGNTKTQFKPGEKAYVSVKVTNTGNDWPRRSYNGTNTIMDIAGQFYKNAPTLFYRDPASQFPTMNPDISFDTDTAWDGAMYSPNTATRTFASYTGGSHLSDFRADKYFTVPTTGGTYTARFIFDPTDKLQEVWDTGPLDSSCTNNWCIANFKNNQATVTYKVLGANIYGEVFKDLNHDGQSPTPDDPGVSGVKVQLLDGAGNTVLATYYTGKTGEYNFPNKLDGSYQVRITLPSGWTNLSANPRSLTLAGADKAVNFAIAEQGDLVVQDLSLFDQNGVKKGTADNPFFTTDDIFPYVTLKNQGLGAASSPDNHTYSRIYPNQPTTALVNLDSTVKMTNGIFGSGSYYSYSCATGVTNKCGAFTQAQSWKVATPGTYTARAFINFDNQALETNYNNNQLTTSYVVTTPYQISGRVYMDINQNGIFDWGEPGYQGATVEIKDSTGKKLGDASTGSDGIYRFSPLKAATYTVDVAPTAIIADLNGTGTTTYTVTLGPDSSGNNFGFFPKFTLSGNVFLDLNDNNIKDAGESNYAASPQITVGSKPARTIDPIVTNNPDGSYKIIGLVSGTYTIQYNGLPTGYFMNNPRNGPPPTFSASVGTACAPATPGNIGYCFDQNLINVDFAIKPATPWIQAYGLDVRFDTGLSNPIPPAPNAACGSVTSIPASSTTPGVLFSGDSTANFGRGQASSTNWVVGGTTYGELFTPATSNVIDTAYGFMTASMKQSNITPINLASVCTLNNCTLPANLANGVYTASGDVTLNSYTFPANKNFVFLINGNLTINGAIHVPTTATATFSTSGNITVAASVGRAAACPAPATGSGDVEGMYSADKNVILQGNHDCTNNVADKQLNMQGSIVVNAGQNGGTFQNNRDLCTGNLSFPTFTIKERPDFILNAPDFIKTQSLLWQEVAP
jgi:hypothetical protein